MAWDIADYPFTDEQWYAMCDQNLSRPVPLHEADLSKPFVYYRPWGLMYVPSGYHQGAMATLYSFQQGCLSYLDAGEALGIKSYRVCETLADRFLTDIDGTAFRSAVGRGITAGRPSSLDARERLVFKSTPIIYLDN